MKFQQSLEKLIEAILVDLPIDQTEPWSDHFRVEFPYEADLEYVLPDFIHWLLDDQVHGVSARLHNENGEIDPDLAGALEETIALYHRWRQGDRPDNADWVAIWKHPQQWEEGLMIYYAIWLGLLGEHPEDPVITTLAEIMTEHASGGDSYNPSAFQIREKTAQFLQLRQLILECRPEKEESGGASSPEKAALEKEGRSFLSPAALSKASDKGVEALSELVRAARKNSQRGNPEVPT